MRPVAVATFGALLCVACIDFGFSSGTDGEFVRYGEPGEDATFEVLWQSLVGEILGRDLMLRDELGRASTGDGTVVALDIEGSDPAWTRLSIRLERDLYQGSPDEVLFLSSDGGWGSDAYEGVMASACVGDATGCTPVYASDVRLVVSPGLEEDTRRLDVSITFDPSGALRGSILLDLAAAPIEEEPPRFTWGGG